VTTGKLEPFARFAKKFHDGEIIFSEFELGDSFYLIQEGKVELVKLDGNTEKTIAILQPLEMFGEMAILELSPRSATAIARGECILLEFNSKNFQHLMLNLPELALKMLKLFIVRINDSKNRYLKFKKQDPRTRIMEVVAQVEAELPEEKRSGEHITLDMSIATLARLGGLTETQTREVLNELLKEKRIETGRNGIIIKRGSHLWDWK
jgi:CRP-like cAMP-binding protein